MRWTEGAREHKTQNKGQKVPYKMSDHRKHLLVHSTRATSRRQLRDIALSPPPCFL